MEVKIAEALGFCFGAKHAIALAKKNLVEEKKDLYCMGSLIHNKQVVDRLGESGMKVVDQLDQVPQEGDSGGVPTVLIRSHGTRPEMLQAVKDRGLMMTDATCTLVKKAQEFVKKLHEEGYKVVLIGDANHPEVKGVVGYAPDVIIIDEEDEIHKLPKTGKIGIISQTTHSAEKFGQMVGKIAATRRNYQEIKVINTICFETAKRQEAAGQLCDEVDVMFVVGSKTSANTTELASLCKRKGLPTHHLQNWQEFEPAFIEGMNAAGVTAGASTPDWIIQEFVDNLRQL